MEGTPPALRAGAAPGNLFLSKHQPNRSPQKSQRRGWWLPFSGTPLTSKPSPCSCYSPPAPPALSALLVPYLQRPAARYAAHYLSLVQVPAPVFCTLHQTPHPHTTQVSCRRDNGRRDGERHGRNRTKPNYHDCPSTHAYASTHAFALSPQVKVISMCGQIEKASQRSTGSQVRCHHARTRTHCANAHQQTSATLSTDRKKGGYFTSMYGVSRTQSMGHQSKRGKSDEELLSENSSMASLGICTGSHARRSNSKRGQQQQVKAELLTRRQMSPVERRTLLNNDLAQNGIGHSHETAENH